MDWTVVAIANGQEDTLHVSVMLNVGYIPSASSTKYNTHYTCSFSSAFR